MAVITEASQPFVRASRTAVEERSPRLVKLFAAIGVLFLLVEAYIFFNWFESGNAVTTPDGVNKVPGWMRIVAHSWEIGGIFAMVGFLYFFLVRPWRREGRITLDGLFCLVFMSLYWQDPLLNYFNNWYTYSTAFWNLGSWTSNVPGWLAPKSHLMPEPAVWSVPIYVYCVFGVVVFGNFVIRAAKRRWPSLGTFGLVMICWATMALIDGVLEPMWMRLGFWTYPGALKGWTLNYGHYYQYPIYEAIIWGSTWTAWACLRYFRDDKGRTLAERGIDDMKVSPRKQTALRFLGLVGVCNLIFLLFYNIPIQFFALRSDPWPNDILNRSYLTNGMCGPNTDYACNEPGIPTPRVDSVHISPDGKLVVPPGTKFPTEPMRNSVGGR